MDLPACSSLQLAPTKFTSGLQASRSVSPQLITFQDKYWNFNQLSISYSPHKVETCLRHRLTRPRRTLGRKPWVFGGPDSHRACSLLMPAFSLPSTPPCLTAELHCAWNAPLPPIPKLAHGTGLWLRCSAYPR